MNTLLLIRTLYQDAFHSIRSFLVRHVYKLLFWFCFGCYLIVLYAFIYRVATGFAFD